MLRLKTYWAARSTGWASSADISLERVDDAGPSLTADLTPGCLPWRWTVLVFIATLCVYAALVPRVVLYSSPPTGDQAYYLMDLISLVQDHDLEIANNYA